MNPRIVLTVLGIRCSLGPTDSPTNCWNWIGMIMVIVPSPLIRGIAVNTVDAVSGTGMKFVETPAPCTATVCGRKM